MQDKIWANSGDSHFLEPDRHLRRSPAGRACRADAALGEGRRRHEGNRLHRRRILRAAAAEADPRWRVRGRDDRDAQCATAGCTQHLRAAQGPRPGGHLGRGHLPVARHVGQHDHRPGAGPRGREGRERLGAGGDPERRARPSRRDRDAAAARRGGRRRRGLPRQRASGSTRSTCRPCPPKGKPTYNHDYWEPLWAAVEETGLVLAFHIGTDGDDRCCVPRARRRGAELRRDDLRRPARRDAS